MKTNCLIVLLLLFSLTAYSQQAMRSSANLGTVTFDLAKAVITNSNFDIPVSVNSEDSIVALDFTISYNGSKLNYTGIIDLIGNNNLYTDKSPSNSNPASLFSFGQNNYQYPKAQPVINIRFTILSPPIQILDKNDFTVDLALINGDIANSNVTQYVVKVSELKKQAFVKVFPNPASSEIYFETIENAKFELINQSGVAVLTGSVLANQFRAIHINHLAKGLYFVKLSGKSFTTQEKIIIK